MIHLDSIAHIRKVWSFPQVMSWNCSSSETEITHVISWHSYQLSSITFLKSTVPLPSNSSLLSFSLSLVPFFPFLPFIASLLSSLLSIPLPPCSPLLALSPSLSFPLSPLYPPPSSLCRSSSRNNFTFHHLRSPLEFQNNVTVTNKRIHLGRHGWADVPQR